jgi:FkbM family methyltransferase
MRKPSLLQQIKRFVRVIRKRDFYFPIQKHCACERHGSHYGGWVICSNCLSQESIVYSVGLGTDITFDLSLINQYGLTVHGFDPTPKSTQWLRGQPLPLQFELYEYGLANFDGTASFYAPLHDQHVSFTMLEGVTSIRQNEQVDVPVFKLQTIMSKLNHDHIDLLKMDIEGAEYAVLADILNSGIKIKQLLIEFHHRFGNVSLQQTKDAIQLLNNHNFQTFYIAPSGDEYCFIRS